MPPEIDLTDFKVLTDPFTAYDQAREASAVARLVIPGFGPFWALTATPRPARCWPTRGSK